tara:strand:+ start:6825 stop:6962 length:138 start_codon:yes stop_codon:yes gene_type:complete
MQLFKNEEDKRAKLFMIITIARIVSEITIIVGFVILMFVLVKRYV